MFSKPILMKCGHYADTIMTDVPYNNEKIHVAACSFCFDQLGNAIQAACNMAEQKPEWSTPVEEIRIKRNYTMPVLTIVACVLTLIALIASL